MIYNLDEYKTMLKLQIVEDVGQSLDSMIKLVSSSSFLFDETILQKSNLNHIKKSSRKGIISSEEENRQISKIKNSTLEIIEELKEEDIINFEIEGEKNSVPKFSKIVERNEDLSRQVLFLSRKGLEVTMLLQIELMHKQLDNQIAYGISQAYWIRGNIFADFTLENEEHSRFSKNIEQIVSEFRNLGEYIFDELDWIKSKVENIVEKDSNRTKVYDWLSNYTNAFDLQFQFIIEDEFRIREFEEEHLPTIDELYDLVFFYSQTPTKIETKFNELINSIKMLLLNERII